MCARMASKSRNRITLKPNKMPIRRVKGEDGEPGQNRESMVYDKKLKFN